MPTTPQEELKKLLEEYKKLTGKPFTLFNENNVRDVAQGIETLKNSIKAAEEEAFKLEGGFEGLRRQIIETNKEFGKQSTLVKDINKLYSKAEDILKDLKYDERDISKLSEKELKNRFEKIQKIKDEARFKAESLIRENKIFDLDDKQTQEIIKKIQANEKLNAQELKYYNSRLNFGNKLNEEEKAIVQAYIESNKELDSIIEKTKERYKEEKKITKQLGVFGGVLKGIGKLPIIGDIVDTEEALKAAREEVKKTGSGVKGLKAGLGNLKTQFIEGLLNPANLALGFITQMIAALKTSDEATGKLAKDFNLTYNEAANVRNELIQIGNLSGDVALNARALQETMVAVGQSLGSNAMLNQADLEIFTKLREQAGFTNEELIGIEKTTLATGGNLKNNVQNLMFAAKTTALNNKVLLNEKDIMRDVSKASDAIKLSVGGSGKALGAAAAQAKALGMNLGQVDKIAESLLNFEQSISAELEAELLTGRDLNLEQARLYAINNDMEGLSRELAKNFGTAAEFSKMNRLQQEAAAKAVGMSREELATTLTDQEALKGLSGKQAEDAKAALDAARARGMSDKEIAEAGIDNLMRQQSVQERLNASVEKLKEIFISIAEPIMQIISPIVDILTPALSMISGVIGFIANGFSGIKKIIEAIFSPTKSLGDTLAEMGPVTAGIATALTIAGIAVTAQLVPGLIRAGIAALTALPAMVSTAVAAITSASAMTLGIGAVAIVGGIIAAVAAMKSASSGAKSMKDGVIDPNKGPVLSGDFGSVQLNPRDRAMYGADGSIKVGTNLLGNNKPTPPTPTPTTTPSSQPVIVNYTAPQTIIGPERIATSLEMQYRV